jgi:hypothetical protein
LFRLPKACSRRFGQTGNRPARTSAKYIRASFLSMTPLSASGASTRTSLMLQPRFRLAIPVTDEGVQQRTSLRLRPRFRLAIAITDEETPDVTARCNSGKPQPRFAWWIMYQSTSQVISPDRNATLRNPHKHNTLHLGEAPA